MSLEPGDVLLYSGGGLAGWLIKLKTWSDVSHVELYVGGGRAFASRDGIGVRTFDARAAGLYAVLRPVVPVNLEAAAAFHATCTGQGYDWIGLLRFVRIGKESKGRQFCSEYVTRLLRAGGVHAFGPGYDADLVSPGMFLSSPVLVPVWLAGRSV